MPRGCRLLVPLTLISLVYDDEFTGKITYKSQVEFGSCMLDMCCREMIMQKQNKLLCEQRNQHKICVVFAVEMKLRNNL